MGFSLILAQHPEALQSITGFFSKGGIFMWPLLVCSIVSVTLIILRSLALREKNVLPLVIESEMERLVPGASPERLARIVHHDASSLAPILRGAPQHPRWPPAGDGGGGQTRAGHAKGRLGPGLVVLEVIVRSTPLIRVSG